MCFHVMYIIYLDNPFWRFCFGKWPTDTAGYNPDDFIVTHGVIPIDVMSHDIYL